MILHKNIIESRGFRLLELAELEMVSGGDSEEDIVVYAPRPSWNIDLSTYAVLTPGGAT